jgi:hypothetical protein
MNPLGVRVGQYQREAGTVGSPPARRTRLIAGAPAPPNERYDADIIILGLDRIEETLAAIASASGQRGVSVHIFVLDQGSCSLALGRLERTAQRRGDITLLSTEQNLGVAGGRNLISGLSGLPSFLNCTKHLDEHRLFCEHFGELFDQGL